jgi:hypothetical protein
MPFSVDISAQSNAPIPPAQPAPGVSVAGRSSGTSVSEQGLADTVGGIVTGGTFDGLALSYDAGAKEVSGTNTDKGSTAVTAHEAALNPHPQYHTAAEVTADIAAHAAASDPHGDRAYADALTYSLDDLTDVDLTGAALGDALQFDGTNWVPGAGGGGGASTLDDLLDVATAGAVANDVLTFDGTDWAPQAPSSEPWTYLYLGTTQNNATLVLSDIPDLQFTPGSAGKWVVEGKFLLRSASTGTVPRMTAYNPDNSDGAWNLDISQGPTTLTLGNGGVGSAANLTAVGTLRNANLSVLGRLEAFYITTAASTTPFKMALQSENSGVNVSMLAGSYIRYRKLP